MTKIQIVGQPDPHSSLDCYQLTLPAIPPLQYMVITANSYHPPTTPGGLA
jgi:hypothetical protein